MTRYYILKDGIIQGSTATKENAIAMIREYQKMETHYILKAEFSVLTVTEEETIKYERRG